ncbi:MAG: esterase, partial [Candidatus Eisenbacteria bacterium]|nr:esterase [Candidatus Eisenbacteria bacterium]
LTGFTGNGAGQFQESPWSPGIQTRLNRLFAAEEIPPFVVAFPDCFTKLGGSQFVNSTATGRYRDYLIDEVIPEIEKRYPVSKDRDHRFVFGKSSGGFGALSLLMDRPDVFGGAGCQSGDMGFEYGYLPDFPHTQKELENAKGVERFLARFERAPKKTGSLIRALNIIAMAACYSPNPHSEWGFDLPFDLQTGRIQPAVWEKWLAFDPVRRIETKPEAYKNAKAIFIDCGFRDEFNLLLGARMMHETLDKFGIPHTYEEFNDTHMGISYRYEPCLTALGKGLPHISRI